MIKARVRFTVTVDLDELPGWGNKPKDYSDLVKKYLDEIIPHYHPDVSQGRIVQDMDLESQRYFRNGWDRGIKGLPCPEGCHPSFRAGWNYTYGESK